ncbi:uncharacterized protein LOC144146620 [Haemaphysalis longicornis]
MVDFATLYPDAFALPSIATEKEAEGLMERFSRLLATPYHPLANGLVEWFNGTLKEIVRRMCQERPKNWDRYLLPLLFPYREVPQASRGFSPFDLIYGRYVRGPVAIMKELRTGASSS